MRNTAIGYSLLIITMSFFSPTLSVFALEEKFSKGPVEIEADSISYDREQDVYHAKGKVVINFSGGMLQADSVVLQRGNDIASAEGGVVVKTDNDVLEGDKVEFNLASSTGIVYTGKMFIARNHFYVKGNKIEKKGPSEYRIQDVSLTTCDGDAPDWRLTGRELDVTIDGYGTLKGGKFYADSLPILYIPYLLFPAKTTRQSGFLFPYVGYSRDKLGGDVELPLYVAVSQSVDATFYQRYMDKRGFKEGAEFRYVINKDSSGVLYGDYLHDTAKMTEQTGAFARDWQSPHERWSLYMQSVTSFQPGLSMRTDIARVSDNWYFKDFSSHNYYLDHYSQNPDERFKKVPFVADESLSVLDSTVRIVKDWSLYNLTALVRHTDDLTSSSNGATMQKYPEITLTGIKQSFFGTAANFDLSASFSENYAKEGQKGSLFDFKPAVSLPVDLGGNFRLSPEVEARGTYWARNDDGASDKQGRRSSYRLGANLTTAFFRDYAPAGTSFERIRHEIKPELIYNYIPSVDQSDLPDFADKIVETHSVTTVLTSTLTTKTKNKEGVTNYLEILRFKISESFDIREARRDVGAGTGDTRHPFGAIDMEVDLKPMHYFSFYVRNRFNVDTGVWEKANYDLNISDQRGDAAVIGYRYTRDLLEEINLSMKVLLTKSVGLVYVLRRDELNHTNFRNGVTFNYQRQCWSIGLTYTESADDRSVMLSFSLNGLGSTGKI